MKHFYRNFKMACLVAVLSVSATNLMAQREVQVPEGSLLNEVIHGDTTDAGDRVDDNTIYVLERGKSYEVSAYIRLDVPLQIKSAAGDGYPAFILPKPNSEGAYSQVIRTRGDVMLDDVYISNSNGAGNQPKWGGFRTEGADANIVIKNCKIEMDKASAIQVRENGQSILIENCIVGRMGDYNRNNGNGRLIDCREFDVKKIEVRNTTMYHLVDRIIRNMNGGTIDEFIFNQNTGLQIQGYHGLFHLGTIGKATITNNLFLNPKYMGNHTNVAEQTGPAPDNENHYLVTADTLLATTSFTISNNNFYYDDEVLAFFERYDTVSKAEVLAPIVAGAMGDAAANAGMELDFTFDNDVPTINYNYLDSLFIEPTLDPTAENWPMPEGVTIFNINCDFTTTHDELLTGSTEGGQLGSLQWKGSKPTGLSNTSANNIDVKVYPNPASDMVTVSFTLKANSTATVALLDVAGKTVKSSSFMANSGNNNVSVDLSEVPSGLYFYSITTNEGVATSKLLVTE